MNRTNHSPAFTGRGRRWLAGFGLVSFAIAALGIGCATAKHEDQADLSALPKEVRNGLDRAAELYPDPLGGVTWSNVAKLNGADRQYFQLRGANGRGRAVEVEITAAGRVIEVEEHGVPFDEVPAAVMDALKTRIPYANPERVGAIYQAGNPRPAAYGFAGRDGDGQDIEVFLTADGKTFLN